MARSRDYFRRQAIQRRRDPELDARVAADSAAMRARFEALLVLMPAVQQLAAAAQAEGRSSACTD